MKISAATRSRARHYAMQAIYQWQMTGKALAVIETEFHVDVDMAKVDVEYFKELFYGVAAAGSHSCDNTTFAINSLKDLDNIFSSYLKDMAIEEIDPVTLALLRMSSYELVKRIDVPYRVVINESLNLAKKFGAQDSHKFINGVLDKVALKLRRVEVEKDKENNLGSKPKNSKKKNIEVRNKKILEENSKKKSEKNNKEKKTTKTITRKMTKKNTAENVEGDVESGVDKNTKNLVKKSKAKNNVG